MCFPEGSSVEEPLSWPATASKRGVKVRNGITGEPWANAGGKGVSRLVGYCMGYYTIWLAVVKGIFGPVLGNGRELVDLRHDSENAAEHSANQRLRKHNACQEGLRRSESLQRERLCVW